MNETIEKQFVKELLKDLKKAIKFNKDKNGNVYAPFVNREIDYLLECVKRGEKFNID